LASVLETTHRRSPVPLAYARSSKARASGSHPATVTRAGQERSNVVPPSSDHRGARFSRCGSAGDPGRRARGSTTSDVAPTRHVAFMSQDLYRCDVRAGSRPRVCRDCSPSSWGVRASVALRHLPASPVQRGSCSCCVAGTTQRVGEAPQSSCSLTELCHGQLVRRQRVHGERLSLILRGGGLRLGRRSMSPVRCSGDVLLSRLRDGDGGRSRPVRVGARVGLESEHGAGDWVRRGRVGRVSDRVTG
jgi:hypothetical protein